MYGGSKKLKNLHITVGSGTGNPIFPIDLPLLDEELSGQGNLYTLHTECGVQAAHPHLSQGILLFNFVPL